MILIIFGVIHLNISRVSVFNLSSMLNLKVRQPTMSVKRARKLPSWSLQKEARSIGS
jgi:hypothetical protein